MTEVVAPLENVAILDAAERCIQSLGLDKATIDDMAREAGVSRATLYRRTGGREAIIASVIRRHAKPFVADTVAAIPLGSSFAEQIKAGMIFAITRLNNYPLLKVIFDDGLSTYTLKLLRPVYQELVDATLSPALSRAQELGILAKGKEADQFYEWLMRSFLYLVSQSPWQAGELDNYITAYISPVLSAPKIATDQPEQRARHIARQIDERLNRLQEEISGLRSELRNWTAT